MLAQQLRTKEQTFSNWPLFPNKVQCKPSELTPVGAAQHVLNGMLMNERYIDNWGLFTVNDYINSVFVRSTAFSRTFQSSLAFMYGLLGNVLNVRNLNVELGVNNCLCFETQGSLPCSCPAIEPLIDTMAATFRQLYPEVMGKKETIQIINHFADVFGISFSSVPKVSHLMDMSMVHVCHKAPLPGTELAQCVAPWAVADIYNVIKENGQRQTKNPTFQTIAKLKCLPLLDEIKTRMIRQKDQAVSQKFVLYSGHDSSIDSMAIALNFSQGHWPPYASRIIIELYSSKQTSMLFVRIIYNGKDVTDKMEFCQNHIVTAGSGQYLCPFSILSEYIDNTILKDMSHNTYNAACVRHIEI
jgi:hypothetical protein